MEKDGAAARRPSTSPTPGVSSASAAIQRRNEELEKQLERLENVIKSSGEGPELPTIWSDKTVGRVCGRQQENLMDESRDERIRHLELRKMLQKAQELDLAFIVDATKSMGESLDEVKTLAPKIANDVKKAFPKLKLRVAFVPYRDYSEYHQDEAEKCDFTNSFEGPESVFEAAIAKVKVRSGQDIAEDVFSGLERAATLRWSSKTRVLIHIGDAPCHGKEFHDLKEGKRYDSHPEGDLKGRDISQLLKVLRHDCQILKYVFVHLNGTTKKMLKVFREKSPQGGWIQEEKLDDISKLLEFVVTASCTSIATSSRIVSEGPSVPKYSLVKCRIEIPQWKNIKYQNAVQFSYKLPATLEKLFEIVDNNGSLERQQKSGIKVKIARDPFTDVGTMRWPYHAQLQGWLWKPARRVVVKRFKELVGEQANRVHTIEAYCEQMEVHAVAAFLAKHFNQELNKLSDLVTESKTVQFTAGSVLRVGASTYYNMEPWLEGTWIRHSNNVNYVNTQEYADTLHAFSHWTYQRSNGLLMVTDLQGVQVEGPGGNKVFMLCDPAVHCKKVHRYELTHTNWSTPGMNSFFKTHDCNIICRRLNLEPKS